MSESCGRFHVSLVFVSSVVGASASLLGVPDGVVSGELHVEGHVSGICSPWVSV